jgi:hypothetical protein
LQPDINIPFGSDTNGPSPYYAIDVEAEPGSPHSVAVSRGVQGAFPRELGGILLYDDAVARAQSVSGAGPGQGPIDSLLWNPNGQSLYGIDTEEGTGLYIMSIDSMGLQLQGKTTVAGTAFGSRLHFDSTTGYIYSDAGEVLDPATNTFIGSFPIYAAQGGFNGNTVMVPDGKLNIAYFVGQTVSSGSSGNYYIEAFDLTNFKLLGSMPIANIVGVPSKIIRWGSNGLAVLTGDSNGAGAGGDAVYLISGAFVTSPAP